MNYDPFTPPESRTAILTFSNGKRVRAEVLLPTSGKPLCIEDVERNMVRNFPKTQPHAVHKLVKVHILRT